MPVQGINVPLFRQVSFDLRNAHRGAAGQHRVTLVKSEVLASLVHGHQ